MARTQQPPINIHSQGAGSDLFHHLGSDVWIFHGAVAPTDGTSGDGAGWAGPGSIYINRTASTGTIFRQSGTKASPVWTAM